MITATEAAHLADAYDQEANYQKLHDGMIGTIESCVRVRASAGETMFRWVPSIRETVPQPVLNKVRETLTDAGYSLDIEDNIWNISWRVPA